MAAHTWKGKITKLDAKVGTVESLSFVVDMKTDIVHYTSMIKFELGNATHVQKGHGRHGDWHPQGHDHHRDKVQHLTPMLALWRQVPRQHPRHANDKYRGDAHLIECPLPAFSHDDH